LRSVIRAGNTGPDFGVRRVFHVTNTLAVLLGAVILGGIAWDVAVNDSTNLVFLGKKLLEFIEWIAFWR